jgi:hypothetical protein
MGCATGFDEFELLVDVGASDADHAMARLPPIGGPQFTNIGDLGIKMPWKDVEARSLPKLEQPAQGALADIF